VVKARHADSTDRGASSSAALHLLAHGEQALLRHQFDPTEASVTHAAAISHSRGFEADAADSL